MNDTTDRSIHTALVDYLAKSKACFVQDAARSPRLRPHAAAVEDALSELERQGRVLIRPHSAGDPHLEGADLRIVALVQPGDGGDALGRAIEAINKTWDEWLADYLANHRCT